MPNNNQKELQEKLWATAVQLRANSSLKLNQMAEPILGLVFLKFADVKFRRFKMALDAERANSTKRLPPITPDHYKEKGVLYLPEEATYSYLMNLSEDKNIGKAINEAMKVIELENKDLAGVLPKNYTEISKDTSENSRMLLVLLKTFNQIPDDIDGDAFGGIYEFFLGKFARSEGAKGGEFCVCVIEQKLDFSFGFGYIGGYVTIHRNRRASERRQIDAVQCADRKKRAGGELSFLYH